MDTNYILIGLLIVFIVVFIFCSCTKKKIATRESYADTTNFTNFAKNTFVARPSFRADLSPRFDNSGARTGAIVGTPPPFAMQGAPTTPVSSIVEGYEASPTFATMGGAYDTRLPQGGLTSQQVNEIMAQKFGRSGSGDYTLPESLLPVPDMRKSLAKDPSNPSTFMYDRYLFAPLKRRYGKVGVDFVRGDLQISPIQTGWFSIPNPVKTDLMSGYFQDYLDIAQSTSIRDAVFERAPTALQNADPWGNIAQRTTWSLL